MTGQPAFFEVIRSEASQTWDQLEQNPRLAGPWHLLFMQVQSPRHVLSELLQNADDAGATEASVHIEDGAFVFTHNGEDFTREHFASLCDFGNSNKRTLHTIGFRGIGFKSTFSLGDTVELSTRTLRVAFDRQRFSEPRWVDSMSREATNTEIRVAIVDEHRKREVEKNLGEWLKSPVSLLFFANIRRLRVGDKDVHWGSLGPGPVTNSEWMALYDDPDQAFLVVRSSVQPFPPDALSEIRQERLLGADQEADLPPCRVEIVLGAKGRLYVVLPTGVETALPFASNAPFIQDPARLKIKDPEISPANRWLLDRIGALAASVMMQWLEQTSSSVVDRSGAYGFFPDVDREDNSLEGTCSTLVQSAFDSAIEGKDFLLTDNGGINAIRQSIIIPRELLDIWPAEQAAALLDGSNRSALSRHVSNTDRQKLVHRDVVEQISKAQVLTILQTNHLPRPSGWLGLLRLWAYVAPEMTGYRSRVGENRQVRIVPVQGKDVLFSASEVVRLGEKRLLQSDADWDFLATRLLVLNQNWTRYLAEQRREAEENKDQSLQNDVDAAYSILNAIKLEESSDVSVVVEKVALEFFKKDSIALSTCFQLAQIAAKLGVTVGESFRFVDRTRHLRPTKDDLLFDADGTLEEFFPEDWSSVHFLHRDCATSFDSCTSEEWLRWISSGRAGLHAFAPLAQTKRNVWGRPNTEADLRKRGYSDTVTYPYVTNHFIVEDWDFEDVLWSHWTSLARNDAALWARLLERILAQPEAFWSKSKTARALQVATTGNTQAIAQIPLLPAWILHLRELPCLADTRGFLHLPSDLVRRTPATEAFMDVETFVHGRLDTEATRPLLTLLGVRDTPTGPSRLLDCLRALAKAANPPVNEVDKWYRRLDQMVETCSTTDFATIRKALREEKIVLTESSGWASATGVFLSSVEEDVPGAPIIRSAVRDLAIWRKIDIAERPTADLAIQWLSQLPSGQVLSQDEARRTRALMARHAVRIWNECGHWLSLAGEWVPTATISYALTMQTLVPWSHLHVWVKQKTADLQHQPVDVTEARPFCDLAPLAGQIVEQFNQRPPAIGRPQHKPWLNQIGIELRRIVLDDQIETTRIRSMAARLADTTWQPTPGLEIVPYVDGKPAGTPRSVDVVWLDKVLYVDCLPNAKLARVVPDKLGKLFVRPDVTAALNYSFGRSPYEVTEYLEENFELLPPVNDPCAVTVETTEAPEGEAPPHPPGDIPPGPQSNETSEDADALNTNQPEHHGEPESDTNETFGKSNETAGASQNSRPRPKATKPSIIERFAQSQEFRKDGENRFFHPDGGWIGKSSGGPFPWERRTATGEIACYYWPRDHCLENEPLQIESEVWGMIEKFPETHSFVLSNPQGEPIELTGAQVRALHANGKLTLYPATYRLVYADDNE